MTVVERRRGRGQRARRRDWVLRPARVLELVPPRQAGGRRLAHRQQAVRGSPETAGDWMSAAAPDLSVFERFGFERPPVGLKFSRLQPRASRASSAGSPCVKPLPKPTKARRSSTTPTTRYAPVRCRSATRRSGRRSPPARSAPCSASSKRRAPTAALYEGLPKLDPGTARYVAFAPLGKLTLRPGRADHHGRRPGQAEVLLRASTYTLGGHVREPDDAGPRLRVGVRLPVHQREAQLHAHGPGLGHPGPPRRCRTAWCWCRSPSTSCR